MVLETPFTCTNGHNFTANAKLRAKCPECGVLVRRKFQQGTISGSTAEEGEKTVGVSSDTVKTPVVVKSLTTGVKRTLKLIRKGQERKMPARATKKAAPVVKPSAVANGLVKRRTVHRGVTPTIKRPPKKTAVARVTQVNRAAGTRNPGGSYADQLIAKVWPF